MIIGTGVDIVTIQRFRSLLKGADERFVRHIFTQEEAGICLKKVKSAQHFSGKFAAKEAVFKALKMPKNSAFNWKQIAILNDSEGSPEARLSGPFKERADQLNVKKILLSISHCRDYAVATAILTDES